MSPVALVRTLLVALAVLAFARLAAAQEEEKRAELKQATLNVSALQPGKPAMAAVVLEVKKGYHAQSSTPIDAFLFKFRAEMTPDAALKYGEPILPKGETHTYPTFGPMNVYEGRVVTRIPIEVPADAKPGPVKIAGRLRFQVCDDAICYQPESAKFQIDATIVPADQPVTPVAPELFESLPTTGPSTAPATAPAVSGGTPGGVSKPADVVVAGFTLANDAYLLVFALAFVVGIVFNAVPCVLPVLPLKAMGFYEVSQHNRAKCISLGLVFSLGVVAAFTVLGLLVVVLRTFQWGELFSNPWFAGALVIILVVMALNMFGLFTVNLPAGMYAFSPRHDTYFGNFLFGILTAALSTPCTFGMFVGLLTWALAQQNAAIGLLMVVTVGAGMAFPYLVLSAFPELARKFPRTGPWAELVKQLMAFLLLAVAAYFAQPWIAKLTGPQTFWWVLFALIAAAGVFLVVRSIQFAKTAVAPVVAIAIALLLVVPSFLAARQLTIKPYQWQPYSPELLAQARASNKVVLVEFTADWCATCHTLEALVLNRKPVIATVDRYDVEMLKADLSDEAAPGWALLRDLKANGVPLTVIYPPKADVPIRLPGIYEVKDLQDAIERASSGASTPADPTAVATRG